MWLLQVTVKNTDQKPKGICEGPWRIQRPSHLRSLACMLSVLSLYLMTMLTKWALSELGAASEGALWRMSRWRQQGVLDSAWSLLEAAFSCPAASSHHSVFAQCAEPVSQWPMVLPIASVVGDQGEWLQVKGMVAHAWFPELQTETLSHEKYRETRIVPGFSVLDTKWALVSYQT